MLVEIFTESDPNVGPMKLIAIQYDLSDGRMESIMRKANALFDTQLPGMSPIMQLRISQPHLYRTAVLKLHHE